MKNDKLTIREFCVHATNPYKQGFSQDTVKQQLTLDKEHLHILVNLSRTSLKLVEYFLHTQNAETKTVHLNTRECKTFTGFKQKRSIYNALSELLRANIISRTNKEQVYYWNFQFIGFQ